MLRPIALAFVAGLWWISTLGAGQAGQKPGDAANQKPAAPAAQKPTDPSEEGLPVKILEAKSEGAVKYDGLASTTLAASLTLENTGKVPLTGVSIDLSRFLSPSGELVDATVEPARADIPAGDTRRFMVYGMFLAAETYSAAGRVRQAGRPPMRFSFEVVRTKGKPAVDIGDLFAIQETARLLHAPLLVPLRMRLYSTGPFVTLPLPVLHSAVRKDKADSQGGEAADATLDWTNPPAIAVGPDTPASIDVPVHGLGQPGRYDLKLRFAKPGFELIEKDVTVYVRDPWWIAALFILTGLLISMLLRAFVKTIRPSWQLQARVAGLLARLTALEPQATDEQGERVVAHMIDMVKGKWDQNRAALTEEQLGLLDEVASALATWLRLRIESARARPAAIRQTLLTDLDDAAKGFQVFPLDATKVATALEALAAFPKKRENVVAAELKTQLAALEQELQKQTDPRAASIRQALLSALAKVTQGHVDAALGSYDTARLQYASWLADVLRERLTKDEPPGIPPADWQTLVTRISAALDTVKTLGDPDQAMTVVKDAANAYVLPTAAALRGESQSLPDHKGQPVLDILDRADSAITSGKITDALKEVQAALEKYDEQTVGKKMGATAAGGADVPSFDALQAFDVQISADELARPGAQQRIRDRLARAEPWIAVAVILVATLSGLQVLWVSNLTWGGWASYLAAFGWGLAFEQFSIAALSGLKPT